MSTHVDSANLILKLYELRREDTMRAARDYVFMFDPKSPEDYVAGVMGSKGAYIRMVTSYWEMACSFVTNGAIDARMFDESNGEHFLVFGKIEPFLADLRKMNQSPTMFKNLEQVCLTAPNGPERLRQMQARIKQTIASRTE